MTAETSDGGDTFDFTLRYPGETDSTFSVDMATGLSVPGKTYLEKNTIVSGTGTNIFGANLSSNALVQFTPDKDFIRFLLGDGASAQVEGYYGFRTPTAKLPSSGITIFDVSSRSISPYDTLSYSSGKLDTRMSVNWGTGKVFGIDRASPHPGSGVGVFLGEVDSSARKIDGQYMAKTDRFKAGAPVDLPRYLIDTGRGNTNLQIYGENAPVGLGGTFSVNWYDELEIPSYTSMLMAGFADPVNPSYTSVAQGETWKGFAVGFVHNRSNGDLTIGRNTNSDDVQMTFKPNSGQFSGSITVNDGVDNHSIATADSDSVYVSPQAFGAIKMASAPQHIATTTNGNEQYNFLTWGSWSKDVSTSPQKSVFAHSPWIAGRLTPGGSIPTTGSATYQGDAWGQLNETAGFTSVTGDTDLTANFGPRTLTRSFQNMKRADGSAWTDINVNANWGAASNAISGTLNATNGMTGNMNAAFFGSSAQEVGGNWQVQGGGADAAGVFTGRQ